MSEVTFRPYCPSSDEAQVYALWQRNLGHLWPLEPGLFRRITTANDAYREGDHLFAWSGDQMVGFVGTQSWLRLGETVPRGAVLAIVVDASRRRQGIGRELLHRALDILRRRGVARVQLGGGVLDYFWPGVPVNLDAWPFFAACGWRGTERAADLITDLDDYRTPPEVYCHIRLPDISVRCGRPETRSLFSTLRAGIFLAGCTFTSVWYKVGASATWSWPAIPTTGS